MSDIPHTGRCICGQVHFRLDQEPGFACHCHCDSCRRASGAPYVTWVTFPVTAFHVTRGELEEHASSPKVVRGHCAACGTSITYTHDDRPEDIDITASCFDDPSFIVPKAHIWLEDKAHWVEIGDDDLPRYQQRISSN